MNVPKQTAPLYRSASTAPIGGRVAMSGCSVLKKIACAAAVAACTATCVASGGTACAACFGALGASSCIDCL